ncbi:LacI family DNA-binding transcriptional regulator [Dactylosporangium aurantiacum]|uniref:LacI family DNA-binding transcriptional regulator n=1 Tax=Dactylosporangium aurantiacum TaxID=35754 RepID=A0A9Q9IN62_9ACTN|nr:LacI family DNA-binding transcriptional regulator [Dactylosporangium aurantiacum]MDG6109936.1 LacI family DNA-binding transcriptional regulator [Dactylosporangium aurantiacum]UWZ58068.1 LacI family DNA-binding transcriptional regulator [Dactylosporangium aurantiacum]
MVQRRAAVVYDVARLAGVSHQTVSRVLNGHPSVSQSTRQRVLDAVRQLDYRPNAMARGLAGRRSRIVGVVSFDTLLYGPAATLLGVERAARAAGYGVSIATVERIDGPAVVSATGALAEQSVAGVVVVAPQTAATAALRSMPSGMPVVAVEADTDGAIPTISVDQVAGARMAVEHLLALGHRTVWQLSGPRDWLETRGRIEGWLAALKDADLPAPPLMTGDWSARSGYAAGLRLAERDDVTAVFAGNDQMALGMMSAFHDRGIRVPDDVSIVGFDDIPEAEFLSPPLTTVRQDFDEVGRRCMAALLRLIEADGGRPAVAPTVAPSLIVRDSTAPPAARRG